MTKKIFIIGPDHDLGSVMALRLEIENFNVRLCYEDALKVLSHEVLPDLIISDTQQDVLDSYDLIKSIRANLLYDHVPILLIGSSRLDVRRLPKNGCQAFIRKPFDLDYFVDVVRLNLHEKIENV